MEENKWTDNTVVSSAESFDRAHDTFGACSSLADRALHHDTLVKAELTP